MIPLHKTIALLLACAAALPVHSEDPAAQLGKLRAAAAKQVWETRDAIHPSLGAVRSAILKNAFETKVGDAKVYSRAYFSCEKAGKTFAIELTNGKSADDKGGLKPTTEPRIYCNRPIQPWDEKLVQEELLAHWEINKIGDALTWGLRPFPLRECVSIRVVQEVTLPEGWAAKSAKIEFDLFPYSRELDSIFATCGEEPVYAAEAPAAPAVAAKPTMPPPAALPARPTVAPAPAAPSASAPVPPRASAPAPAPATAAPPKAPDLTWQKVRVVSNGKTNVRAGPTLQSAIVVMLDPGAVVLVQPSPTSEWSRAKSWVGATFEGYIRNDRLVFK